MARLKSWTWVGAVAVWSGCTSEAGQSAGGDVCPGCTPHVGGETSDFGGVLLPCTGAEAPLTPEQRARFPLEELRSGAAGTFRTSLRWAPSDPTLQTGTSPASAAPSGYTERTSVSLSVALGDPVYFEGVHIDTGLPEDCSDWVEFPADVSLSTEDGAVVTTARAHLRLMENDPTARSFDVIDLSTVEGALDLHLDTPRPHAGGLLLLLRAFPDGVHGRLIARVSYLDEEVGASGIRPWYDLIEAHFPDDACGSESYSSPSSTPLAWFGGRSAAQVLDELRPALDGAAPHRAVWLDGTEVDVSVQAPTLGPSVCVHSTPGAAGLTFDAPAQLVTSDGRVDSPLLRGRIIEYATIARSELTFETNTSALPSAEFSSRAGITGIDAFGSPTLRAELSAAYTVDATSVTSQGEIRVVGTPECALGQGACAVDPEELGAGVECLIWPRELPFPEACGRHLR